MLKKLYCDLRARLLGTLGRWARGACVERARRRGRRASGRAAGAWGAERTGWRAAGARGARGRQARAHAGLAAWARGLAAGCALGALGPFSIRFDSFFFSESPNEHCSL